jgi:hypothetical protein
MDGAKGSALEWAVALLQRPSERYALRQRPLPEGVDVLLGIAAGMMPEALHQAARALGESEALLRDAARFYAREVLFFPGADAYRVLGVTPDASDDRIRAHHRLLQAWLHPDRLGDHADDAVFAARVNAAWNQLRTPQRRQAYDAERRQASPQVHADAPPMRFSPQRWSGPAIEQTAEVRWRRRAPILALLALCGLLLGLILRDMTQEVDPLEGTSVGLAEQTAPAKAAGLTDAPPSLGRQTVQAMGQPLWTVMSAQRAVGSSHRRLDGRSVRSSEPDPADVRGVRPSVAVAQKRLPDADAHTVMPPKGQNSVQPVLVSQPAATAGTATQAQPPAVAGAQVVSAPDNRGLPEVSSPESAEKSTDGIGAPEFSRLQAAQQAGELLFRFLQQRSQRSPPIWNSLASEEQAGQVRARLQALQERWRLAPARWQIGRDEARLESEIQGAKAAGAGRLIARWRWREGYWLLTSVSLEEGR